VVCVVQMSLAQLEAQTTSNNTYDPEYRRVYDHYTEKIGKSGRLYNGVEYAFDDFQIEGHPYLDRKIFQSNRVDFDGYTYEGIEIMYDIFRDQLVMAHNDENGDFVRIALFSKKVNGFTLSRRQFIRLSPDVVSNLTEGFYEFLYGGDLKVFARRIKKTRPSSDGRYRYEFFQSDAFFIRKEGRYYSINSKNDLYNFLKDEKKPVKSYVKKNGINRMDFEVFLISTTKYYEELKTSNNK